jgi:large subunit ribosomal protein L15
MGKSKVDKLRGKRSHGKGNTKNNRGSGCKGGKGRAGSKKHKFTKYYLTFGIKKRLCCKKTLKTINLVDLIPLVKDKTEINLKELGYDKILGKGEIKSAIKFKNALVTNLAKEKIEKAGGSIE